MTTGAIIELAVAIGLMILSVVIYRRQAKADGTTAARDRCWC